MDDRLVKISKNAYMLPWYKMTKEEKIKRIKQNKKYPQTNCLKDKTYYLCKDSMDGIIDETHNFTEVKLIACVIIQKYVRGNLCRKENLKLKDLMSIDYVIKYIKGYNLLLEVSADLNNKLKYKKVRKNNYPSEITENITKFAIARKYNIMGNWDIKPGDLKILTKQIEVKGGFIENGPPSFGPDEKWDWIYFVDCDKTFDMIFKVYEIKKSNYDFHSLRVNKSETFGDQCIQKRRPRIVFSYIKEHFKNDCNLIFEGHISELR